jgi:hypothetical protein
MSREHRRRLRIRMDAPIAITSAILATRVRGSGRLVLSAQRPCPCSAEKACVSRHQSDTSAGNGPKPEPVEADTEAVWQVAVSYGGRERRRRLVTGVWRQNGGDLGG